MHYHLKDVIILNTKIVQLLLILHLNVLTNHVLANQVNVQLNHHAQELDKFYVLIILVLTAFLNVRFLINVLKEFFAQINHVNHLSHNVVKELLVKLDIHYV